MPYENYAQWKIVPISEEPKLSIVIPAYNERERIVATIGAIASHVSDLGFPWEMFIADDGSKD
ncbi:MAG TPA: glycosyltransferase, partial [Anaerolineales bacterium]|nr:glycosyltransferase [Anaerolineales bacterium]